MKKSVKASSLKNGISLISLAITIVVVVILAATVVLSLNNNNLIGNAKFAVIKSDLSKLQDVYLVYIEKLMTEKLSTVKGTGTIAVDSSSFNMIIKGKQKNVKLTLQDIGIYSSNIEEIKVKENIIVGMKRLDTYYDKDGKIITKEEYVKLVEELGEGTRDKNLASYDVPYVPAGFSFKEGNVGTGYVIQDSVGNEFVWIPVDGTIVKYEKDFTYPGEKSGVYDGTLPLGVTSEQTQITNYQGFYIARYEAGIPENQTIIDGTSIETSDVEGIPVSKKGVTVWTNIYKNLKVSAENMINTEYVKSGLITGTMWDTVMDYLYDNGNGVNVASDSSAWGNYSSGKRVTGYSDKCSYKGIYDMAGNCLEYTNELYSIYRILRGGSYLYSGSNYPASTRGSYPVARYDISFRVALYVL